jgi:hypothetical protein
VRVVYANCPVPDGVTGDLLLTDERIVAAAWPGEARLLDERIDPDVAQRWSAAMWDLAFTWFLDDDGRDPTVVDGVSAGDLGAFEAALTVLLPAARAVLGVQAGAADAVGADELVVVAPEEGTGHHGQIEGIAAEAAALALGASAVQRVAAPQDEHLLAKYRRTRDPDWLSRGAAGRRALRAAVLAVVNARFALRRRPSLYVYEYPPTRAFARQFAAETDRPVALVRAHADPGDLKAIALAGDRAVVPLEPHLEHRAPPLPLTRTRLDIAGVDVWPAVGATLRALLDRYARYATEGAGPVRRELRRSRVKAVLVPFDGAPTARLLVRVAQAEGIPTVVLNDGFKADDLGHEGMAADVALTWSALMRDTYFRRRSDGTATVTGNPRAVEIAPVSDVTLPPRRVLVGGFTYSPMDLNCRRSDVERFTTEVLDGVAAGAPGASVTLKLHPADEPGHYATLLAGRPALEVIAEGDVLALFGGADVYVSTYTTSLIEAAAAGLPIVYYRVNPQRIGPPFDGDPWLERRTATTPEQLAALLQDADLLREPPPEGWLEHVLGPRDGHATDRIRAAINAQL